MNWYKKAQAVQDVNIGDYFDIGHYNPRYETMDVDKEGRKIALWQADKTGGHFEIKEFDLFTNTTHEDEFADDATMYQGRYDPIKNMVSIVMPVDSQNITRMISVEEIPNRLIKELEYAFPTASIYAFEYGRSPIQIV